MKNRKGIIIGSIVVDILLVAGIISCLFLDEANRTPAITALCIILAVAVVVEAVLIIFWNKICELNEKTKRGTVRKQKEKLPEREIEKVKVLGTNTGFETRVLATYNFTVYSLLIIYKDGGREVIDCKENSKIFNKLLPYLETTP